MVTTTTGGDGRRREVNALDDQNHEFQLEMPLNGGAGEVGGGAVEDKGLRQPPKHLSTGSFGRLRQTIRGGRKNSSFLLRTR